MTSQETIRHYKLSGTPSRGLAMATFGYFIGFAAVTLYGPLAKVLKESMGLSGLMLGFLVAAPQLSGSLLRIPFGAMVDRDGGKRPLLILLMLSLTGMAGLITLLNVTDGHLGVSLYPVVLLLGILSGSSVATFSVGIPQTAYWFPKERQGYALGLYAGIGNMAPGIFVLIIPFALTAFGVVGAYTGWFIFLLCGTVIYALKAQDAYYFQLRRKLPAAEARAVAEELGQEIFPSGTIKQALALSGKNIRTWALALLYFASFGGFLALIAWSPAYWMYYHHTSVLFAGVVTALFFSLTQSAFRAVSGRYADRFGGERTARVGFIMMCAGALVLIYATSLPVAIAGKVLMGVGMGVANAAIFKLLPRYVSEAVGGASGWVGGVGAFGGFIIPPLLGLFIDMKGVDGYHTGFVVPLVLGILSLVVIQLLVRRQKQLGLMV